MTGELKRKVGLGVGLYADEREEAVLLDSVSRLPLRGI
jgi:aspartate/tyrosine/aromatic aminotransferase